MSEMEASKFSYGNKKGTKIHDYLRDMLDQSKHHILNLIVLNCPIPAKGSHPFIDLLFQQCKTIICADGGANRLHEYCSDIIPTLIIGDLDSLHSNILSYYANRNCKIIKDSSQDTNDLQKSLSSLMNLQFPTSATLSSTFNTTTSSLSSLSSLLPSSSSSSSSSSGLSSSSQSLDNVNDMKSSKEMELSNVETNKKDGDKYSKRITFIYGGGGRFDQEMCNLNALYEYDEYFDGLIIVSEFDIRYLLSSKYENHIIHYNGTLQKRTCGLIPLGRACESVTTKGLEWNLDHSRMQFGGLISSSNRIKADTDTAHVQCSDPLLWISVLKRN